MAIEILMPALSPTMEEGKLAKWLVKIGDKVKSGQIIAEIETDKATMEVESIDEGVVLELLAPEGAEGVRVNAVIARLSGDDAPAPKAKAAPGSPASVSPASVSPASVSPAKPVAAPTPAATAEAAKPGPVPHAASARIAASPLARRIAGTMGIDLSGIVGSGPNGRVVKKDLEGLVPNHGSRALTTMPAQALAEAPRPARTLSELGYDPASYELRPMDGMRRTIARRLTDSFRDVPHFPLNIDLEIDALLNFRKEINTALEADGVKISVNDFIIRACALSLKRVPAANASFTPEGIAFHRHADIAVAVAIEGGLITPIIKAAEAKSVRAISTEMADLAARARARKLKPHEFQGGTFSLSNLGMMGIRSFASILNEPHGAILSVGAGEQRPIVRNGALAVASVMSVTLTCDHRVVDGAIGAEFLKEFRALIEKPLGLVA